MDCEKQILNNVNGTFAYNLEDARSPHTPIDKGKWKPLPGYRLKTKEMTRILSPHACQPRAMVNYGTVTLGKPLDGNFNSNKESPKTPIDRGKWKPLPGYRLDKYTPKMTPPNACQPPVMAKYRTVTWRELLEGDKKLKI